MATLDRKLKSDLRAVLGQAIAIALVLGCGIATFVMSTSMIETLESTCARYYDDYRFGDLFVRLERAPRPVGSRLAEIPGVAEVRTRIVRAGQVDMPTLDEPANVQLVSIGDDPRRDLNRIHLRSGRLPDPNREGEVVVAESFALAHGLRPGATLDALLDGRRRELTVVGVGLSPEFVFLIEPGQFLPDDRRFGVLWMAERQLAAVFRMEGAFDEATFRLQPSAVLPDVRRSIDRLLDPFGGTGVFDRSEQESHKRLADELSQLRSMATVSPFIFLIVAAFLFHIAVSRLIDSQRDEIATLRAFGYTAIEIGLHYLKFMLVLALPGMIVGIALGYWLSLEVGELYMRFFRFPFLDTRLSTSGTAIACSISLLTCLVGGGGALRRAMRLAPADAMRPPTPPIHHADWTESLASLLRLPPLALMVLRRLRRSPNLAAMTLLGIALSEAVLVMGTFVEDTVDYVIDTQFRQAQRQDATVVFVSPRGPEAIDALRQMEGVERVEPFRAVPVRIRHGRNVRRLAIQGLVPEPELFRVLDQNDRPIPLAPQGLTISEKLAEVLQVRIGDSVELEVLEGSRPRRTERIAATFRDYTEPGAYMTLESLDRLMVEGHRVSGAHVRTRPGELAEFQRRVKRTPIIATCSSRQAMLDGFRRTFAENLMIMRSVNLIFATILSLGVIYNCARITLAERSRELATMRVLGFTKREVAWVLWGELGVLVLAAVPVGLVIGYFLCVLTSSSLDTETHRFPVVIRRATFAYAATVVLLTAIGSAWIVRLRLDRLDLMAVLKSRE